MAQPCEQPARAILLPAARSLSSSSSSSSSS
eukprot:CAMPEP_0206532398 /NCGR_PEP_ID=MMETSP0325_2-20121206/4355_1 /ASSEMBLY_ACC=CAM_ASM_000347 /TAXON_ID=2866 /ORGANISM="Crypthecodinium cohnii, Strain Seligo" /LENGTH=30 /DNA_ID= /DNA_START= /DNA_END= /DNA_ORIENTATION=